jgi:glycosyltransferase involved in cell wall biosynthesis
MHLAYLTSALPFGCEETYIVAEILEVQRRGHRVSVIPIRPGRVIIHEDARRLTGVSIAEPVLSLSVLGGAFAEFARAPLLALRAALLLGTSRNLRTVLKNLVVFPKALWLARIARRHGVDHIHAHFASTNATVALVAGLLSGVPWSFTAHRWDISGNNLLAAKTRAAVFARAIDLRGAEELAGIAGAGARRIRVIHMGVALRPSSPERADRSPGPLRVLLAARIDEFKGHRHALEAIAQLKAKGSNVSLRCAGDGPSRRAIEKHARELDVMDRVQFPGWVDHEKLLAQLEDHAWDVALLPSVENSLSREGIPVFLIEAMAAGVPVVATNTGGIPELLGGGAGVLIAQEDSRAIAEALGRLAADGDLRRQLAEAGVRRVREQFAIEATVSSLLAEITSGVAS